MSDELENENRYLRIENDILKQKLSWIKTGIDEEPEMGKRVLIQTMSKMVMIADLTLHGWRTHESQWKEYVIGEQRRLEYLGLEQVTHWMPLPEATYE